VAYLAKKPDVTLTKILRPEAISMDPIGEYPHEDAYPGDDELHITNDSFTVTPSQQGTLKQFVGGMRAWDAEDTAKSVLTGVSALTSSTSFDPHHMSFQIYISGIRGDTDDDRNRFVEACVLEVRINRSRVLSSCVYRI
jgi:hypothetical protein